MTLFTMENLDNVTISISDPIACNHDCCLVRILVRYEFRSIKMAVCCSRTFQHSQGCRSPPGNRRVNGT